jgi:RHS repeat-associated protein
MSTDFVEKFKIYLKEDGKSLETIESYVGDIASFGYDANNNSSKIDEKVGGSTFSTSFTYDKDNKLKEVLFGGDKKSTNTYDAIGRLTGKSIYTGSTAYNTSIGYKAGANGSATTQVESVNNNGNGISYTYDANGNIETITENDKEIKYYYDELNEVIREDNQVLNKTITYSYDAGGNITSKSEYPYTIGTVGTSTKTYNYSYGDSNWKDKLTSYDGKDITYDAIGNPLTYDGNTYTWEAGRQLSGITGNGNTIIYKYNDSGIRTQKTVNGVTTKYYLSGDKVTYETNGTDNIHYTYESSDNLVSMNLNGTEYYYIRNAQGDIIGLIDSNGTQVANYTYDTWGKLISIKDENGNDVTNDTNNVGYKNPYRYRGYRYDTETGLYYLQSRYFNPEWGRFINADGLVGNLGELLSHNMFIYCCNNPVNVSDPSGMFGFSAFFNLVGAVVATAIETITAVINSPAIIIGVAAVATAGLIYEGVQLYKTIFQSSLEDKSNDKENGITEAGTPNSKSWNKAKKKIKEGKGKGINVKARNEEEAERLINEAKPDLEKRPTYEANPPKSGYEVHPVDNEYDMPHIKWRDWSSGKANGADGHIFWDK